MEAKKEEILEDELLKEGGVRVTNLRVINDGQTFAISGVTSVRNEEVKPNYSTPLGLLLIGLLFGLINSWSNLLAILFTLIGIIGFIINKTEYAVTLTTASGETRAIKSIKKEFIDRIVEAINKAIVLRG
ncbi:MAG: DUF6232 family protein [Bdellovibrionota bacterium]